MSDNNWFGERLAKVEQKVDMIIEDSNKQQDKIDNISDQMKVINKIEVLMDTQIELIKNQDRLTRAMEISTNNLSNTVGNLEDAVNNINDNLTKLNENQRSFAIKQIELEQKVQSVVDKKDDDGKFNWMKFVNEKLIPVCILGFILYVIYQATGIKF